MIIKRVLKRIRETWPETRIILRGGGHFSNPALMQLTLVDPDTDFIFGLTGNPVLSKLAAPHIDAVRKIHQRRGRNAAPAGQTVAEHSCN